MSVDVSTQIVIDRPRERVAAYVANPDTAPDWYVNIKSIEWETEPPLEVGSKMAFVAHFLGRRIAYTYEVTELVEHQVLTMSTAQGPFPMTTTYSWESVSERQTRMTLRNHGEPAGFSKLMAPLMEPAMRRANRKDLERLKLLLESE